MSYCWHKSVGKETEGSGTYVLLPRSFGGLDTTNCKLLLSHGLFQETGRGIESLDKDDLLASVVGNEQRELRLRMRTHTNQENNFPQTFGGLRAEPAKPKFRSGRTKMEGFANFRK